MPEISTAALIRFAVRFRDLGDAVGDQVRDLVLHGDEGFNVNAIKLVAEKLGGVDDELDALLAEAIEQGPSEGEDV